MAEDSRLRAARDRAQQDLTLLMSWRQQATRNDGESARPPVARVATEADVTEALREACVLTLDVLADRQERSYSPEAELLDDQYFWIEGSESRSELELLDALVAGSLDADEMRAQEIVERSPYVYGVAVGQGRDVVGFIKKANPVQTARAPRFLAWGGGSLRQPDEPIFAFSPPFDVVLTDEWAAIINELPFRLLMRESPLLRQQITTWVDGIASTLSLAEGARDVLLDLGMRDSRLWGRLNAIHRRGHLAKVTVRDIERYAKRIGIDRERIVDDGKLVIDPSDRFLVTAILNEDLFRGLLSDEVLEAHRKDRFDG